MEIKGKKKVNKISLTLIIFSVLLFFTFIAALVYLFLGFRVAPYTERYSQQISSLKKWYQNEYQKEFKNQTHEASNIDLDSRYKPEEQAIIKNYVKDNHERFINNISEIEKYNKYDETSFQAYEYNIEELPFDVDKIKSYKKTNIVNQIITRSNIANNYDQLDTFIFENNHFKKYDYQASNNKLFITRVLNPRTSLHYETDYTYSFTNLTDENQYIIIRQNDFRLMFEENKSRYPELTNFVYGKSFIPIKDRFDLEANDVAKWNIDYTSPSYWNSTSHKFIGQELDWFYQYKQQYVLGSATMGLRWHLLTDKSKYDTFLVIDRVTKDKWNLIFPNTYQWKDQSLVSDVIQVKPKEKIYLLAMFNQLPFNTYKVNTNQIYDNSSNWQIQQESMFDVKLCLSNNNCDHAFSSVQSKWNELLSSIEYDRKKYKDHNEVIETISNYIEFCKYGFRLLLSPGYKSQFLKIKIRPYKAYNFSNFINDVLSKNKWQMNVSGWPSEIKDETRLYYSFHNINGLYEFYRSVNLQIKDKFRLLIYFTSQNNDSENDKKVLAYTKQPVSITDDYRIENKSFETITNYNINFNFDFDTYYKITPFNVQNRLRKKPVYEWNDDEFNYFFTLFDNHKKFYTQVGDENTVFYHEYTHILGQDHGDFSQTMNMDQTAFAYLPVFSHEIMYI